MIVSTKAAVLFPPLQAASSTCFPRLSLSLVNNQVSLVYSQSRPPGLVSPLHTYSCFFATLVFAKGPIDPQLAKSFLNSTSPCRLLQAKGSLGLAQSILTYSQALSQQH